jgi:hypothetical protein
MNQPCEARKSIKKKKICILISIVLVVAIAVAAVWFVSYITKYEPGTVTHISIKQRSTDVMELRIRYSFPTGGYSARVVPEDEGEYIGDGMIDYDGSLGKYRVMVNFGDTEPSLRLSSRLRVNNVIKHSPVKLKASIAHPEDHGFVLYIGSDKPISVEPVEHGTMNALGGTIKISIAVGTE